MARKKPGPKPERLKIDGEFEDALRKALRQERPEDGWPDHQSEVEGTEEHPEGGPEQRKPEDS